MRLSEARSAKPRLDAAWRSLYRFFVGTYWLYFAASKWAGVGWVKPLLDEAPKVNPIPGLRPLLEAIVVPNWLFFAVAQTVGETIVGVLLVVGLATRLAGVAGTLLATGLALVISFEVTDGGFQWLYFLAVLATAQVVVGGPGPYALDHLLRRGAPARAETAL